MICVWNIFAWDTHSAALRDDMVQRILEAIPPWEMLTGRGHDWT
jgi:hypothetical protein